MLTGWEPWVTGSDNTSSVADYSIDDEPMSSDGSMNDLDIWQD